MLCGGDEIGRTQQGNNNAFCQDNALSWFDWEHVDAELLAFVARLVRLRLDHPVFRRRRFFHGRAIRGGQLTDIAWFRPDGAEMAESDWTVGYARALGMLLDGDAIPDPGPRGERIRDDTYYVLLNAADVEVTFVLPGQRWARSWVEELRTTAPGGPEPGNQPLEAGAELVVASFELALLRRAA